MKRPGRPTIPSRQRKVKVLCARTDSQSYRTFARAAQSTGMRLTDWVRDRLAQAAERDLAA